MKGGKIILSSAALLVTLVSSLAFKSTKNSRTALFSKNSAGTCSSTTVSCFTVATGGTGNGCVSSSTYYTKSGCTTASKWTGVKTSND